MKTDVATRRRLWDRQAAKEKHQILSVKQLQELLTAPDTTTVLGLRDRAVLEVLYATGLWGTELFWLMVSDIDFTTGKLTIRDRTGEPWREVVLPKRALLWLRKYLQKARPVCALKPGENALFLSQHGRPLQGTSITQALLGYLRALGLNHHGGSNLLRDSITVAFLDNAAGGSGQRYKKARRQAGTASGRRLE